MSATEQVLVLNNYNIENEKQFGMKRNNLIHEELSSCFWQPTPRTADVTVSKIAGYVRVGILMNR